MTSLTIDGPDETLTVEFLTVETFITNRRWCHDDQYSASVSILSIKSNSSAKSRGYHPSMWPFCMGMDRWVTYRPEERPKSCSSNHSMRKNDLFHRYLHCITHGHPFPLGWTSVFDCEDGYNWVFFFSISYGGRLSIKICSIKDPQKMTFICFIW